MALLSLPNSLFHFPSRFPFPPFNGRISNPPLKFPQIKSSPNDIPDLDSNNKAMSSFDFLQLKREMEKEKEGKEMERKGKGEMERKGKNWRRQMVGRSSLIAKQVISVGSARSLGFISQLWIDTNLWIVALVEVRPNLLSGEMEKFLLDDICQVGDVVLVKDEIVLENELKLVGLDNLIGYNVVTTGRRRNVGKVRGFTFNINSGSVESLELDSFGFSLVPSSLVSTYCLSVEDIVDVVSDTIFVDEESISRLQRLTKGIWGAKSIEKRGERRYRRRMRDLDDDDWDLPMDY